MVVLFFGRRVMTYLGKSHNLWHRVTLTLEKMTIDSNFFRDKQFPSNDCYDFEPETIPQQVTQCEGVR